MSNKRWIITHLLILLLLFILAFIRYSDTLKLGYWGDDIDLLNGELKEKNRILPYLIQRSSLKFFGENGIYLHSLNVFCDATAAILLYLLIQLIFKDLLISTSSAVLFLTLPSHIYAIQFSQLKQAVDDFRALVGSIERLFGLP